MQITIASKRRKGEWRAALIVDNVFQDAMLSPNISDLIADSLVPVLSKVYPEGTEIALNVTITEPSKND